MEDSLRIFRLVAKEFNTMTDEEVQEHMDLFSCMLSVKRYGKLYDKALAYLTAHKLKMNGYGDVSNGTIADSLRVGSYSEGETSISYTTNQGTNLQVDAEYALTSYGLMYLELKRLAVIPIVSAGEG